MRGVEEGHVERRVLAHPDHVELVQESGSAGPDLVPGAARAGVDRPGGDGFRLRSAVRPELQVVDRAHREVMAAAARLAQERDGGVLLGIQTLDRIDDEEMAHGGGGGS